MNFNTYFIFFAMLFALSFASGSILGLKLDTYPGLSNTLAERKSKRCDRSVCFAIEGSKGISAEYFDDQKRFITLVTWLLSASPGLKKFSAVQYGTSNEQIAELTDDWRAFTKAVQDVQQVKTSETFLTGGINFCFSSLYSEPPGKKVIVVVGSGQSTIGSDPKARADLFFNTGGRVITVGIGQERNEEKLDELRHNESKISITVPGKVWGASKQVANFIC